MVVLRAGCWALESPEDNSSEIERCGGATDEDGDVRGERGAVNGMRGVLCCYKRGGWKWVAVMCSLLVVVSSMLVMVRKEGRRGCGWGE